MEYHKFNEVKFEPLAVVVEEIAKHQQLLEDDGTSCYESVWVSMHTYTIAG
jgi:hypothetical protein